MTDSSHEGRSTAQPDSHQAVGQATTSSASPQRPRRRTPPLWAWGALGLSLLAAWLISMVWPRIHDIGFANIGVWISLSAGIGLFLLGWLGRFGRKPVIATLVVLLLAAGACAGLFRISKTTGGLFPTLTWRWALEPDEQLGDIETSLKAGKVDLRTTTPDDFPQFLGPQRSNELKGIALSSDWQSRPPKLVWRRPIGAGWSSFAAVNGFAVTLEQRGDEELVTCYEVLSGEPRWSHAIQARHATVLGYVGPRSTPTIVDGRVYALGATGILRCLDGEDGSEIWSHDLFAEHGFTQQEAENGVSWGRAASPLVYQNRVYVPVGGPLDGPWITLAAYDAQTGTLQWEAGNRQSSYASPSLVTLHGVPQILLVTETTVAAHDPESGDLLWEFPWPGQSYGAANVSQAVALDGNAVFVSKGYEGDATVYDIVRHDDGTWGEPVKRWAKNVMKTKFSNVSILDGHAYGLDHGILACVRLSDGRRRWKGGRYGFGQSLLVGDKLLIISEQGEIALVAATPERYEELARISALDDQTWNNPCLYGRYLLFRNATDAVCYELPLEEPSPSSG